LLHHTIFDHLRALAPHLPFTPPVSSPSNTSRSLLDLRRETVLLSLLFYATIPSHNWMFNPRSRSNNNRKCFNCGNTVVSYHAVYVVC
jgi:hypothetical protein